MASNFEFMSPKWRDIAELGAKAEECGETAPKDCAVFLRIIGERIADELLAVNGLTLPDDASQIEKIRFLRSHQLIIVSIEDILLTLDDLPDETEVSSEDAGQRLRMAHKLCHWFVLVHGYNDSGKSESKPAPQPEEQPAAEETDSQPEEQPAEK